jgi:hypothetical protein
VKLNLYGTSLKRIGIIVKKTLGVWVNKTHQLKRKGKVDPEK